MLSIERNCVQIIVPFSQVGRKNDIYVFCSSYRCGAPAVCDDLLCFFSSSESGSSVLSPAYFSSVQGGLWCIIVSVFISVRWYFMVYP